MRFQTPLEPARLIRRYKRFLADIELADGSFAVAHCPNPGSMLRMATPGARIWVERNDDPRKKLRYGWRLIEEAGAMIAVDTGLANKIVGEALSGGKIAELAGYESYRPEVKYGAGSRVDLLGEGAAGRAYIEVKSVTLSRDAGHAEFPDSVTKRGAKHLVELAEMVAQGHRAVMLYLVARNDCSRVSLARDLDPGYGAAAEKARAAGVEMLCYDCDLSAAEITLRAPLSITL
ncbi:MAG: DNA/RNA nuclease SfsA [Paracoccaceae bacterium]